MHCPQVVDDGALILTLFSAPGTVNYTINGDWWCMPTNPITLGDSEGILLKRILGPLVGLLVHD